MDDEYYPTRQNISSPLTQRFLLYRGVNKENRKGRSEHARFSPLSSGFFPPGRANFPICLLASACQRVQGDYGRRGPFSIITASTKWSRQVSLRPRHLMRPVPAALFPRRQFATSSSHSRRLAERGRFHLATGMPRPLAWRVAHSRPTQSPGFFSSSVIQILLSLVHLSLPSRRFCFPKRLQSQSL